MLSSVFQNNEKVVLVLARKKISAQSTVIRGRDESDGPSAGPQAHPGVKVRARSISSFSSTRLTRSIFSSQ